MIFGFLRSYYHFNVPAQKTRTTTVIFNKFGVLKNRKGLGVFKRFILTSFLSYIMGLFSKTSMDYIVQIIELAKKSKRHICEGKIEAAKRLIKLILKFDRKEFKKIEEETGSKYLMDECKVIYSMAREALSDLEKNNLAEVDKVLEKIITLESHDVLVKVKKYHKIKKELKKRKFDIDRIGDRLGFGIDNLIKPLVATLTYFGFKTEQSCQGHSDHGENYPWVRLHANRNFNELVRVVQEYDLSHPIKWKFQKFTKPSEMFASTVNIIRPDRKELTKNEIKFTIDFCKRIIKENGFNLKCRNMQNYWIVIVPESGLHSEDLRKIYPMIKKSLSRKGYEVDVNIPKDLKESDIYNLFAEGGLLRRMQQDIIHFSDFIINNFRSPTH